MAFTVTDFQDLMKLLGQHPEWQAELRRVLVGDHLSAIDTRLEALVAAQERTDATLQSLLAAQARTDASIRQLSEAQSRTEEAITALASRIDALASAQLRTETRVDKVLGDVVQGRYKSNLPSYLGRQMKRMQLIVPTDLELVAAAARTLNDRDWEALTQIDALFTGALRMTSDEVVLAVEASAVIDSHDVERAVDRAAILGRLGYRTIAAVGGDEILEFARKAALQQGVAIFLGGKVEYWPESAA